MVPHSQRNEQVDITKKPIPDPSMKENLGVTIGDLHANAVKFLFFLIKEGVFETSDENYNELVEIYNQPDPLKGGNISHAKVVLAKQLAIIRKIINELTITNKDTLVRLIGDELADRGKNDLFILLLLNKLQKENINVEILISNHGIEFVKAYEKKTRFKSDVIGHMAQSISMENMQNFIDLGLISRTEIEQIVNSAYLPKLKLISYSMETDKSAIRIYSHAPIDLVIIQKIANRLGIKYKDDSVEALAQTIDAINREFQTHYVATGKANELFQNIQDQRDPFTFLIWNRNYSQLNRNPRHNNYTVYYVHGHDSGEQSSLNIFNLDNPLGKPGLFQGLYDVMHSYGASLIEIKKKDYQDFCAIEAIFVSALKTAAISNGRIEKTKFIEGIDALKQATLASFQNKEPNFSFNNCTSIANNVLTLATKVSSNTVTQADVDQFTQTTQIYKTSHTPATALAIIIGAVIGMLVGAAIGFAAGNLPGAIIGGGTGLVAGTGIARLPCTMWYSKKDPLNTISSAATEMVPK